MKNFLLFIVLFTGIVVHSQDYKSLPFWNYNLPLEKRVNDVVSRLTLEEKVMQMLHEAPAVPRLGIPAYNWWNEVLHGVARTPFHVTVYPQAIAMAATWDTASISRMADYSAMEGRAIHNIAIQEGKTGEGYWGLTYWTPNINIFRDPRWGRGQETYGEDPFLTGTMGSAFVRGLQGTDPKYLKAVACAKHFAVHSGPEPTRHADNFNPSAYDLWDTYLPAFKELVVHAKVGGVMCAYNAINTQPCCGNDLLMNDILRNQWKFTGYVTSDCGAIDDFFQFHKTHPDAMAAAVDALIHGTDLECGWQAYKTLIRAVKEGLVKESQIDVSIKRLFELRFRLGMFDPPSMVPYAQAPESLLESPEHSAHALKMAEQSIVLLKNDNSTLPLSKQIKKIAVLGPNADNKISVLGNYNGVPSKIVTVLDGIKQKLGENVDVVYEKGVNYTNDTILSYDNINRYYTTAGKPGVNAEYFNNEKLEGAPGVITTEPDINHYWSEGQIPVTGIQAFNFSARYTTALMAPETKILHFEIEGDDGYRVFINDKLIVDAWTKNRWGPKQFEVPVKKDSIYKIVVEYHQGAGPAAIHLKSGHYIKTDFTVLVNRLKDVDAIIFAGGISPQLEGEEMPIAVPGFKGGDRTSIALPAIQTELLKALITTGKPVIFVMMTGSAIAIPWEAAHIPAIINAWYGGQSAGTAVANVLFGDYNPAGRLPVTFYRQDADLPDFNNYDMQRRTYRYFKGDALYPFGYGLSYTTFNYSELKAPSAIHAGKSFTINATVTNTGKKDGEEVSQLYISYPSRNFKTAIRALKGFQRIFLHAGESKNVQFTLSPETLSVVNDEGQLFQPTGKLIISVGGGQPDVSNTKTSNVLQKEITVQP